MPLSKHTVLYGGSFDPPHIGHMISCIWLKEALNAYTIKVVPTYEHCFGKELSDFKHRINMCELMIENLGNRVFVNRAEEKLPKPNITYNLIQYFKNKGHKDISVIIGSDLIPNLHKWTKWKEVTEEAKVVAIGRSGFENVSTPLNVYQYPIELSAVSSSEIRERVKLGQDITGLIPYSIKEYIEKHGLYK